jgi:hypothetical protein
MIRNVTMPGAADEQAHAVANRCEKLNLYAYNVVKGRERGSFLYVVLVGGKENAGNTNPSRIPALFCRCFSMNVS